MFMRERDDLLEGLRGLGRTTCAYLGEWPDNRCDCKYGLRNKRTYLGSEQTGCPELRSAYRLIEALTDDEYTDLVTRSGGMITSRVFKPGTVIGTDDE